MKDKEDLSETITTTKIIIKEISQQDNIHSDHDMLGKKDVDNRTNRDSRPLDNKFHHTSSEAKSKHVECSLKRQRSLLANTPVK